MIYAKQLGLAVTEMIIMIKAIKKLALKHLAPYTVEYYNPWTGSKTQVIYAWTRQDALEWVACSLREEAVQVWHASAFGLTEKLIAERYPVINA